MFCVKCGQEMETKDNFCPKCGQKARDLKVKAEKKHSDLKTGGKQATAGKATGNAVKGAGVNPSGKAKVANQSKKKTAAAKAAKPKAPATASSPKRRSKLSLKAKVADGMRRLLNNLP